MSAEHLSRTMKAQTDTRHQTTVRPSNNTDLLSVSNSGPLGELRQNYEPDASMKVHNAWGKVVT
jgi:hypothetical protein